MKRKLLIGIVAVAVLGFASRVYLEFHPSHAFVSHSPTNHWRAVDCILAGFRDVSYDFRAHDLRASPFQPIFIGDLYCQDKYFPGDLFWSRDGTVAAVSIVYYAGERQVFACAYDFLEHRAVRSTLTGSAVDDSKDEEIRRLLQSRGGFDRITLPSYKEI